MAHARIISKLSNVEQQQELANKVVTEGISVRQLEEMTQEPEIQKANPQHTKAKENNEYKYLQESLSEKLGTKVVIKKNKIEINFTNNNDLNRILDYLNFKIEN